MSLHLDVNPNAVIANQFLPVKTKRTTTLLCRIFGHQLYFVKTTTVDHCVDGFPPTMETALGCTRCEHMEIYPTPLKRDDIEMIAGHHKPVLHWCGGRVRE